MTTAQIDEIWHAHCEATATALALRNAKTKKEHDEALLRYRAAERRFYLAWQVALTESDPDPVAESLDREQETVEAVTP